MGVERAVILQSRSQRRNMTTGFDPQGDEVHLGFFGLRWTSRIRMGFQHSRMQVAVLSPQILQPPPHPAEKHWSRYRTYVVCFLSLFSQKSYLRHKPRIHKHDYTFLFQFLLPTWSPDSIYHFKGLQRKTKKEREKTKCEYLLSCHCVKSFTYNI